jgi:hypothetical protein
MLMSAPDAVVLNVLIGGDVDDGVSRAFFPGALDDVEIHDAALDAALIRTAANL